MGGEKLFPWQGQKLCVGGKKRMKISAVLKALLDWEIQVKELNCHVLLKREKLFYNFTNNMYKWYKFCHHLLLLLPQLLPRAAVCPFAGAGSSVLPSLSSSGVTSLLSRAGEPAVRGDVLEGRTAASEGLAAELLQRSAVTCSWGSAGSCLPPVPPSPRPLVAGVQSCWRLAGRMCMCIALQGVGVNRSCLCPVCALTIWEMFGSWIKD